MGTDNGPRHGGDPARTITAWPLRRKVALAVAIPLLLAATLGGLRVRGDLVESDNSSTSADQVGVLHPAVDYLVAAERAMVAAQAAKSDDFTKAVADLRAAGDELTARRDTAQLDADQKYQVDVILDLSRALREGSADSISPGTWVAQLRQLQSGVTQLITTIVNAQIDPEPRLELLSQALAGRFSLAMQQALAATDRNGATGSLELFAELGAESVAIDRLTSALGASDASLASLRTANAERFRTVRTKGTELGGMSAYADYDHLTDTLLSGIDQQLTKNANEARASALANAGVTLGALVAAIMLALLVSRLILAPIGRVREGALSVAQDLLPREIARIRAGGQPGAITPIDVHTTEEIGQLARAVDALHEQAVVLAAGEAELRSQVGEMFVTLSRRSTSLVNQQLAVIEALEKDEEDPKRLQSLFRLDHLAARMRRTGDSLLILADAPTRSDVQQGLTVGDAMQAASAGVQDYTRVRLGVLSDVGLVDTAAGDVVHVLTELVDNALTYSPPSSPVTVSASTSSGGVTLEITDQGIGIPDDVLAELNETLHSGGDVSPDTARRMGLFVVSRLAQRHGLAAMLRSNTPTGTTAVVFLPTSILVPATTTPSVPEPLAVDEPTPEQAPVVAELDVDDIKERINSAVGLPRRRPGESLPVTTPAPPPLPMRVVPDPEPEPVDEPVDEPVAEEPVVDEPVVDEPVEAVVPETQPVSPVPAAAPPTPWREHATAASLALEGEWTDVGDDGSGDTPIFRAMRSAWLSAGAVTPEAWKSSEIEAGWDKAARVTEAAVPINETGLPQRRPGNRLVPGGVTPQVTSIARDPEAIRARLSAHAAGVRRGRHAAALDTTIDADLDTDLETTEAGPA